MTICPDTPNFYPSISVTLRFTTLKDADATAPQTAVTRASVCAESPGFGNMNLFLLYIRIDSEMGWSATQNPKPTLCCISSSSVYVILTIHVYTYIYMYVMIYVWSDESVHTMTMGLTLQRHVGTPIPPNGRSLDPGRSPLSSIQVHSWLVRIVVNRNQLPSSDWFYWRSLESNKTFEKQSLEKSCAKCASVYIRNSSYTGEDEGNGCNLLIPRPSCMITITFFSPQTPQSTLVWSSVF